MRALIIAAVTIATLASQARAVSYNEAVGGDLSDDGANPTNLTLGFGTNSLTGTSVGQPSVDRDYIHFSLPAGLTLDAIIMTSYVGDDGTAFIGVQAGSTFTEPPTGTNPANLLGWTHFGPDAGHAIGTNILDDMGAASPAIGFSGALTGSDYTFWIQQTGASATTYQLDYIVTPEPGGATLVGLAAVALATIRGRRLPAAGEINHAARLPHNRRV